LSYTGKLRLLFQPQHRAIPFMGEWGISHVPDGLALVALHWPWIMVIRVTVRVDRGVVKPFLHQSLSTP